MKLPVYYIKNQQMKKVIYNKYPKKNVLMFTFFESDNNMEKMNILHI